MKQPARFHWDRNTESTDDYLKAIYALQENESAWVSGSKLARRLGIAPASVTGMVQRLVTQPQAVVEYKQGEGVRLSGLGRQRA